MESNLSAKTVLITEAARNFGPPTALAFAAEGANLVLATGDSTDDLAATLQSASTAGVRVKSFHWDVADASQVDLVVWDAVAEFGKIDVVVNNSAVANSAQSFETISFSEWERKLGVEITGTTLVCKAVLPGMIERRWGRIINYIGLSAFLGSNAPDSASELGMVGLARGIARDYGKYNITANCIGPGGIESAEELGMLSFPPSDGDPLPRWGSTRELAFLAVCLASEDAGYVTGQCLLANGGKYFL